MNNAVWVLWRPSRDRSFYDDSVNFISVHSHHELVQPTAVKTHAAYVVIEGLSYDDVPVLLGKRLADFPLI